MNCKLINIHIVCILVKTCAMTRQRSIPHICYFANRTESPYICLMAMGLVNVPLDSDLPITIIKCASLQIGCVLEPVSVLLLCCIEFIGDTIFYLFPIPLLYIISIVIFCRKNKIYTHLIYLYIFNLIYLTESAVTVPKFVE